MTRPVHRGWSGDTDNRNDDGKEEEEKKKKEHKTAERAKRAPSRCIFEWIVGRVDAMVASENSFLGLPCSPKGARNVPTRVPDLVFF